MKVELIDFKTGWYKMEISLTPQDIDKLVRSLENLKPSVPSAHFHCSSDYEGSGGVGEVVFVVVPAEDKGPFQISELKQPERNLP